MIAGLLPIFFAAAHLMTRINAIDQLQNNLMHMEQLALVREKKQSLNMIVKDYYRQADHFYIDKNLETLSFLEPETETLQKLVNNKYFAGDEIVKARLEFLMGPTNDLLFSEGNVQAYPFFQETISTLVHPVEINLEDLKKILTHIEGQPIGQYKPGPKRPQLIILDLKLDKKEATEKNDVFLLNLKLLKREFS
jgi:hypothetical protein